MKKFFNEVRKAFGALSTKQVEGIELLVKNSASLPLKHRAYILATAWHETAHTMQPIEEFGKGKGKKYGVPDPITGKTYYGRGFVQLTWKENYKKAELRLIALDLLSSNVSLVLNPDRVMEPIISANIICIGMKEGWFTTHKMSDFNNYVDMRRVVNGTDKAKEIAKYAESFEYALNFVDEPSITVPPAIVIPTPSPNELPKSVNNGVAAWLIGIAIAAFAAFGAWIMKGG